MQKKISFFLILNVFVIGILGYRFGGELWSLVKQSLAIKFYNEILTIYMPNVVLTESEGRNSFCEDIAATCFPSFSYHKEQLWYDSQLEGGMDYENLAARENRNYEFMLAENKGADEQLREESTEETQTAAPEPQTAAESQEEPTEESPEPQAPAGISEPQTEIKNSPGRTEKLVNINREQLKDFDYLRQNFYIVDSGTTTNGSQLDAEKFLAKDMTISKTDPGPQILIYHTHSQEGYVDSTEGDASTSVVAVGDYLTELLTEKYGFSVLHHKGEYDVNDRDHAYSNAAPAIEQLLAENPSIQMIIDLHRDSVGPNTHLVTEIDGKQTAKIMFFNGMSFTTTLGQLTNLPNPNLEDNLALSLQMQLAAAEYYPDFTRRIYLKGYRYNMHYLPKSMLIEVGAENNTLQEAKNAMEPLADILNKVLSGTE